MEAKIMRSFRREKAIRILKALMPLQESASAKGERVFTPNMSDIAKETNIARNTVRSYMAEMIEQGVLTKHQDGSISLSSDAYKYLGAQNINTKIEQPLRNFEQQEENFAQQDIEFVQKTDYFEQEVRKIDQQVGNFEQPLRNFEQQEMIKKSTVQSQNGTNTAERSESKMRKNDQSEDCLESLNSILSAVRDLCTLRAYNNHYRPTFSKMRGNICAEDMEDFVWHSKEPVSADVPKNILAGLGDLFTVILYSALGEDEDLEALAIGEKDNDSRSLQEYAEMLGSTGSENDVDDDNDEEDDGMTDEQREMADRFEKEREESVERKNSIRPRTGSYPDFTSDEVEDILAGGPDVWKSPLKIFIRTLWFALEDYYYEAFVNGPGNNKNILSNFRLEDVVVESDVFQDLANDVYGELADIWVAGTGFVDAGPDDDGKNEKTVKVDWMNASFFDITDIRRIFNWERFRDSNGRTVMKPSTSGIRNIEGEALKKPVRPQRQSGSDDYRNYLKDNMRFVNDLMAAYRDKWVEMNPLEQAIGYFINTYFVAEDLGDGRTALDLLPHEQRMGKKGLDPEGYLHHEGLNDIYNRLTKCGITPEEFQDCLQNPVTDRSYHSHLRLYRNMFWAQGVAYICAQKGLQSHFASLGV